MTKRKIRNDVDNFFYCKRCGRKTLFISNRGYADDVKYCNSCRSGLAEGGTGNLLEFPCRNSDGDINFEQERYEIEQELKSLGLRKTKKNRKV